MTSDREAKAFLALVFGAGLYLVAVLCGAPGLSCPIHDLLGLECPGCGITRAGLALLRLDLPGAIRWNPMILFLVPFLLWRAAVSVAVLSGRRFLPLSWPRWWIRGLQAAFIGTWILITSTRLATWMHGFV